jgi:hypothetical protein
MLDDGVKGAGVEDDQVKVADISIHVLEALTKPSGGAPAPAAAAAGEAPTT